MRPRSHGQAHRNGVPPPGNHRPGSPHASMRPGEGLTRTPESSAARGGSREMRAGFRAGSERAGAHWPARLPGTPAAGSHRCWSAGSGPACRGTWPRERRGRAAGAAGEWMRPSRSDRSRAGRAAPPLARRLADARAAPIALGFPTSAASGNLAGATDRSMRRWGTGLRARGERRNRAPSATQFAGHQPEYTHAHANAAAQGWRGLPAARANGVWGRGGDWPHSGPSSQPRALLPAV